MRQLRQGLIDPFGTGFCILLNENFLRKTALLREKKITKKYDKFKKIPSFLGYHLHINHSMFTS